MKIFLIVCVIFTTVVDVATENEHKSEKQIEFIDTVNITCEIEENCVRFCCKDQTNCLDKKFIDLSTINGTEYLGKSFKILTGEPICPPNEKMFELRSGWAFQENGEVDFIEAGQRLDHASYCLDRDHTLSRILYCSKKSFTQKYFIIMITFSVFFFAATFLVYAFIREYKKLQGKVVMCYFLCSILLYSSFIINKLNLKIFGVAWICRIYGHVNYSNILACLFWLLIMSYDIWSTFRSQSRHHRSDRRSFILYCICGFVIPVFVSFVLFIFDFARLLPEAFLPKMGVNKCMIQRSQSANAVYIYFPLTIIISFNTLFYAATAWKIYKVHKETSIVREDENKNQTQANKARFLLYVRLFIISGISWVFDELMWLFPFSKVIEYLNILNFLHGVFIFILFVCKRSVKNSIVKRFAELKNPELSSMSRFNSTSSRSNRLKPAA